MSCSHAVKSVVLEKPGQRHNKNITVGVLAGHDQTRRSGQEVFKMSWVGSGPIRKHSKSHVSGRVGSGLEVSSLTFHYSMDAKEYS